ncbi:hypothetical protein QJS10_CPB15g01184 [Acorus calamus]|uniref:Uncharacterized protein n=1 Tax=Acorus calamus TaxID=4465 RepID=A0AAV9D4V3_ACOCL|nr:hypothetical protein QJS10_CPB15g01184 [Acorus calamus]
MLQDDVPKIMNRITNLQTLMVFADNQIHPSALEKMVISKLWNNFSLKKDISELLSFRGIVVKRAFDRSDKKKCIDLHELSLTNPSNMGTINGVNRALIKSINIFPL